MKQIMLETLIGLILFFNIPTEISSQAVTTISINNDYIRITPLTIVATPLNYIALFTDRTGNTALNSTFINIQENLNRTRNLTQQDIQTQSQFVNEKINEKKANNNATKHFPHSSHTYNSKKQKRIISTNNNTIYSKTFRYSKYSQLDYQTFKPLTTSRQTNK